MICKIAINEFDDEHNDTNRLLGNLTVWVVRDLLPKLGLSVVNKLLKTGRLSDRQEISLWY